LKIINDSNETARDVAQRFAQLSCVHLLKTETGDNDEDSAYLRHDMNGHTETKDPILLSAQQKKEAKQRARAKVEEMMKHLSIARNNYIQLGGRLDDALNDEMKVEQATIK
jgi:hypothetical protein